MTRILVVSDLHLAVPGPLNNFDAGDDLAALLADHAHPDTTLVLAGDVFDFLQLDGRPPILSGAQMPGQIQQTLDALAGFAWGRHFFAALQKLLSQGGHCVVLPGNHDPELAHPCFAQKLLAMGGLPSNHPGLSVHTSGPWQTQVGSRTVIIGHGHRGDHWNDINPTAVQAAVAGTDCELPPGSRLVTNVLNAFKEQRTAQGKLRFPFVDLLKPEMPAVPLLLLYLDRKLAMQHLPQALGLTAEALATRLANVLLGTAKLTHDTSPNHPDASLIDDVARALAQTYSDAQKRNPARHADELIEWLESDPSEESSPGRGMLAAHGGMRARMLRAFLHVASDNGRFFDRSHRSHDDDRIIKDYLPAGGPPRVVIAGHTHAAREIWTSPEHVYLNTGTWTDLMAFPSAVNDGVLQEWIDQLESGSVARIKRLTWAEVTSERVVLHEARS